MATTEVQEALFEFEGKVPDGSRHSISGGFATADDSGTWLPDFALDELVTLRVVCKVTKVNHVRTKDGALERQHVLIIEGATNVSSGQ